MDIFNKNEVRFLPVVRPVFGFPRSRGMMSFLKFHRHSLWPDRFETPCQQGASTVDQVGGRCSEPNVYAVSVTSLALKVSIVGLTISATPGIANTLSKSWLRVDIAGLTKPPSILRWLSDNCPIMPLTLSI